MKTFNELLARYLRESARSKKTSTLATESCCARNLEAFFADTPYKAVQGSAVRRYREIRKEQGVSPRTVKRELSIASAAYRWARTEWDWDIPNPFEGRLITKADERALPPPVIRTLSPEDEKRLLAAATPLVADIITFAVNTGLRQSEILNLRWEQIDGDIVRFQPSEHKAGTWAFSALNRASCTVLQAQERVCEWVFHENGRKLHRRRFHALWSRAREAAGVDIQFHDLRRTTASRMREIAGIDVASAQLRHADVRTTQRWYADVPVGRMKDAVRRLSDG